MKLVIGIILVALLMAALIVYMVLMLNANDMVLCGDVIEDAPNGAYVTRVYTTDITGDEVLSEIIYAMNSAETDSVELEQLTEILAENQNIIYAPVFKVELEQVDMNTYVLTGSVYNGLTEKGEPAQPDYMYKNMTVTAGMTNGFVIAAQNIYPENEDGKQDFVERRKVVEPVVTENQLGAAFSFRDTDSFRLVFTADEAQLPTGVTLAYTYDVVAENPLDFTGIEDGILAFTVTTAFDEKGRLDPEITMERQIIVEDNDKKK